MENVPTSLWERLCGEKEEKKGKIRNRLSDSVWEPRFMTGRTLSNIPHEAAHVFVDGLRRALRAAARPVRQDVAPPQKKETARRVPGGGGVKALDAPRRPGVEGKSGKRVNALRSKPGQSSGT